MSAEDKAIGIILVLLVSVMIFGALWGATTTTGPGCPADPDWLGFCSDIVGM